MEQAEGVRVRIFTTQEELPFAGHPTLGTASVLKTDAPETVRRRHRDAGARMWGRAGALRGSAAAPRGCFGEMTQRDPEFGAELDAEQTLPALPAWPADDLDPALPPQVVSTGTAFAIVVLRSVEALARLKVNQDESHGVAARARSEVVLCSGACARPKRRTVRSTRRGCSFMAAKIRPRARRRAAPSLTSWLAARCRRRARTCAPGRGDGPAQRSFSFREKRIGEGHGCARRGQHCSCGKRTAFPAVMHMLSTDIHLRK